jgi:hypothetical protein
MTFDLPGFCGIVLRRHNESVNYYSLLIMSPKILDISRRYVLYCSEILPSGLVLEIGD